MKLPAFVHFVPLTVIAIVVAACGPLTPVEDIDAVEPPPDTAPSFGESMVPDRTYLLSSVTCTLALPEATGGNGDLSYRLTPTVDDWTFDPASQILTIAPTTAGSWDMLYRVEDGDENTEDSDAAELTLTITVTDPADFEPPEEGRASTYQGCGNQVFFLNAEDDPLDNELYTLMLDAASADVYVIATNTTTDAIAPTIEPLDLVTPPSATFSLPVDPAFVARHSDPDDAWHADPSMTEVDDVAPRPGGVFPSAGDLRPPAQEGDTFTFWHAYGLSRGVQPTQVTAVARRVVTDGTISAVFWVDAASWGTCDQCVTYEMVDALANDFLTAGSDNDIYDWVTAIFGAPWGMHSFPDFLMPPEYANEIHVLIFATDEDFGGYHSSLHTQRDNPADMYSRYSNERLMFFVNASTVPHRDGGLEAFLKYRRTRIGRTLAHEYQHMIRHYQKGVLHEFGPDSESWLNEMASEVVEDFVSYRLMDVGNRGVPYDDPTAGSPPISSGHYDVYNYYNYLQASYWEFGTRFYAHNYALGSYLALTYGGAPFMAAIAQNEYSGTESIEVAIAQSGYPPTSFGAVLSDWAVANLLSDDTQAPSPYRYNSGEWSVSQAGGTSFQLGSVNLFNYRYYFGEDPNDYHDGPYFFSVDAFNAEEQLPHSNRYVNLGRHTDTVQMRVNAPAGARISVVVKE